MISELPLSFKIVPQYPHDRFKIGYVNYRPSMNRRIVDLYNSNTDRTSIQYARYLAEITLGRFLLDQEHAHHGDFNSMNDCINNITVLSKEEHAKLHIKYDNVGRHIAIVICPICGVVKAIDVRNTSLMDYNTKIISCSRQHSGVLSASYISEEMKNWFRSIQIPFTIREFLDGKLVVEWINHLWWDDFGNRISFVPPEKELWFKDATNISSYVHKQKEQLAARLEMIRPLVEQNLNAYEISRKTRIPRCSVQRYMAL